MKANELIQQITEQVHKNANVRVVFGDAIDKGDITIIPVAKVTLRGGGGGGQGGSPICIPNGKFNITQLQVQGQKSDPNPSTAKPSEDNASTGNFGMGLGLEIKTIPLGYIHIKNGEARYKEIVDTTKIALNDMLLAGFMMLMFTRMVVLIIRKFKTNPKKLPNAKAIQK